jgi:sugar lactone lactonase YvrE
MSYPYSKRRLRPARGVALLLSALMAGGAAVGAMTSAQAAYSPAGSAGTIQTMAGFTFNYAQGGYGPEEILATQSQFFNPRGLGFASDGSVYVTDALNNRVRKIDPNGNVHLVAGNGTQNCGTAADHCFAGDGADAKQASMWEPHGVAVDSANNVYIADSRNCVIRMVAASSGLMSTIAGTGAQNTSNHNCLPTAHDPDGPAKGIALDTPKSIFMSKENGVDTLWVTDSGNNEIRKIDVGGPGGPTGATMTRIVGNNQSKRFGGDGGPARDANLRHSEGIWVAKDGTIYLTDGGNNLVRKVDTSPGRIITTIAGDVASANTNAQGNNISQLPGDDSGDGGPASAAHLDGPRGITGDDQGNLYVAEENGARVRRINLNTGIIDTIAGDGHSSPVGQQAIKGENGPALGTQFNFLHDIEINPADGSLWVADSKDNRVRAMVQAALAPGAVVPTGGGSTPTTQPPAGGGIITPVPGKSGYWMLGNDGKMFAFGDAKGASFGDASTLLPAGAKAVHIEPTPSTKGYWINDDRGDVYAFGDAASKGGVDASALQVGEKVTSLSATPTGAGYWIFTSKGRVFTFGDAGKFGDLANLTLNGAIQSSIPTPSGKGYFMVGSDGGVFAFGDAVFRGSMGGKPLNQQVQSLVPTRDGLGYWLVASDGGIFAFGNAPFKGSMGSTKLNKPVVGMVRYGNGYLMVGADGGIFSFSDKPFVGSLGANPPARPIVFAATLDS